MIYTNIEKSRITETAQRIREGKQRPSPIAQVQPARPAALEIRK